MEKVQGPPKVRFWCGITATTFAGPFLLRDIMNAKRYLEILLDSVWPVIFQGENIAKFYFMQDRETPSFCECCPDTAA
jgi:hypothetical protein